jgi:general secretion pathway protein A
MYEKRYSLKRRPFPTTPDGSLYYPATEHESSLATLQRSLAGNEGFALLTGAPGTGKTLLGLLLLERLESSIVSGFLTNSHFADRRGLLQAILFELGLQYEAAGEQELRLRLTEFLLKNCQDNKKTVIAIDEAQNLTAEHLEELRLLGNLEAGSEKAVQFVLLGQPRFLDLLRRPEVAALRQRLAARLTLPALGVEESLDYLLHHLRMAGARPERIADDASLEVLARGTHGIPRLLNQAAHQAFLLADAGELPRIDAEAALEALTMLGLDEGNESMGDEREMLAEHPLKHAATEVRSEAIGRPQRALEEDDLEDEPGLRLAEETRRPA